MANLEKPSCGSPSIGQKTLTLGFRLQGPAWSWLNLSIFMRSSPRKERDELLQCLLIAAPRGGEAMIKVIQELLCHATEELLEEHGESVSE